MSEDQTELSLEAPEADAAEQHLGVRDDDERRIRASIPVEADPADAADQDREVGLDEDDYR